MCFTKREESVQIPAETEGTKIDRLGIQSLADAMHGHWAVTYGNDGKVMLDRGIAKMSCSHCAFDPLDESPRRAPIMNSFFWGRGFHD